MNREFVIEGPIPPDQMEVFKSESEAIRSAIVAANYTFKWDEVKDSLVSILFNIKLYGYHFIFHNAGDDEKTVDAYVREYDLRMVRRIPVAILRLSLFARLQTKCIIVGQTFVNSLRRLMGQKSE